MTIEASDLANIYDVSTLVEHSVGDVEFAEELLERFHSRLGSISQSLEERVHEGNLQEAARVAHSLKGEAGIMAAVRLREAAAELEQSLRKPENRDPMDLLNQVNEAVDQCLKADPAARNALNQLALEK